MHFFETVGKNFGNIDYTLLPWVVLALIGLALIFDFLNGLHDAANSIATIVSTRVLTPQQAVMWAAFFNFIAFMIFNLKVAGTIGKGIIDPDIVSNSVIAGTLIGACAWNILTWYWGLPTSSSHALIGGLVGAGLAHTGWSALVWEGIAKTCVFILVAPMLGLVIGLGFAVLVYWIVYWCDARPRTVDWFFRRGQLLSAALYSLGHGGNDAQKTMGIILVLLIAAAGRTPGAFGEGVDARHMEVPTEVVLACHLAMGLGTLMGGWRIVKTMGQRIIRLRPVDGFCAESGAAFTLILTLFGGIPVSTTHTITGSIVGVGAVQRLSAVRWGVAGRVVWAWVFTIPGAAIVSALCVVFIERIF
ncbi:MAG: inorganic phosphate transporter [Planctomycetes bacterium]|nr:inorganic phosphate transporter [Planctomycetota bacterium]